MSTIIAAADAAKCQYKGICGGDTLPLTGSNTLNVLLAGFWLVGLGSVGWRMTRA